MPFVPRGALSSRVLPIDIDPVQVKRFVGSQYIARKCCPALLSGDCIGKVPNIIGNREKSVTSRNSLATRPSS